MPVEYKTFGRWVKERRKHLALTQETLARKANISLDTLRAIEQDRPTYHPSEVIVCQLFHALDIPETDYTAFVALGRRNAGTDEGPARSQTASVATRQRALVRRGWFAIGLAGAVIFAALLAAWFYHSPDGIFLESLQAETKHGPVGEGDTIQAGEWVTVTFQIRNVELVPVWIRHLVIGSRRGDKCAPGVWGPEIVPFTPQFYVFLWPGQSYRYQAGRVLDKPGPYFVEPNFEDMAGRGHGISPTMRLCFTVAP